MENIYIARQPILDRELKLYGYELLFRPAAGGSFPDGDTATSAVIWNALNEFGLEQLVDHRKAFVNLTDKFLTEPDLVVLPSQSAVLEMLETTQVSPSLLNGLKLLKQRGFMLALDDYQFQPELAPLLDVSDIVKIDITGLDHERLAQTVNTLKSKGIKVLAEKVETQEEYLTFEQMGFDLYQGYFFAKPATLSRRKLASNRAVALQLISKLQDGETGVKELAELITRDVALSVGILKFANSPANALVRKVDSVQQAIVLLGPAKVRNWSTLLLLARDNDKPNELFRTALYFGRCCEQLAKQAKKDAADSYFTTGLLSVLDAMMDAPLVTLLEQVGIEESLTRAILTHEGDRGEALRAALALYQGSPEDAQFDSIASNELSNIHVAATLWADESLAVVN